VFYTYVRLALGLHCETGVERCNVHVFLPRATWAIEDDDNGRGKALRPSGTRARPR
jgi:hypothetical protein